MLLCNSSLHSVFCHQFTQIHQVTAFPCFFTLWTLSSPSLLSSLTVPEISAVFFLLLAAVSLYFQFSLKLFCFSHAVHYIQYFLVKTTSLPLQVFFFICDEIQHSLPYKSLNITCHFSTFVFQDIFESLNTLLRFEKASFIIPMHHQISILYSPLSILLYYSVKFLHQLDLYIPNTELVSFCWQPYIHSLMVSPFFLLFLTTLSNSYFSMCHDSVICIAYIAMVTSANN